MTKVLAVNGSYRDDGVTDKAVDILIHTLLSQGVEVEYIHLRDHPIEFCLNCRECTQQAGEKPGKCVIDDGLNELVEKIESADAYIFASPTNFGSVTALYKRFMERLVVYGYWPWGAKFPLFRKAKIKPKKKAILVSSSAAPGFMGRWFFGTVGQLKKSAETVGAKPVAVLFTGMAASKPDQELTETKIMEIQQMAEKLV
jgi:multimeric flavodoxin WrbA